MVSDLSLVPAERNCCHVRCGFPPLPLLFFPLAHFKLPDNLAAICLVMSGTHRGAILCHGYS